MLFSKVKKCKIGLLRHTPWQHSLSNLKVPAERWTLPDIELLYQKDGNMKPKGQLPFHNLCAKLPPLL